MQGERTVCAHIVAEHVYLGADVRRLNVLDEVVDGDLRAQNPVAPDTVRTSAGAAHAYQCPNISASDVHTEKCQLISRSRGLLLGRGCASATSYVVHQRAACRLHRTIARPLTSAAYMETTKRHHSGHLPFSDQSLSASPGSVMFHSLSHIRLCHIRRGIS